MKQYRVREPIRRKFPRLASVRNKPCVCGSGKKFKQCCLETLREAERLGKKAVESETLMGEVRFILASLAGGQEHGT